MARGKDNPDDHTLKSASQSLPETARKICKLFEQSSENQIFVTKFRKFKKRIPENIYVS